MADYSRVPKAVFDADLDVIILSRYKHMVSDPDETLERRRLRLPETLTDALMMAPKLTVKVMGSNVALAVFVQIFGADVVEELLREKALEFILWRDYVGIIQTPGPIPFVTGNFNSAEESDPEASNMAGLAGSVTLTEAQRKRLVSLATENTTTTARQRAEEAWQTLIDAHKRGGLAEMGIPPDLSLTMLTEPLKSNLGQQLAHLQHALEIIARELDLYESPDTWKGVLQLAREVTSSGQVVSAGESVLREDHAPSLGVLVARGALAPRVVMELRQAPAAKAFREWLWTRADPTDGDRVLDEYRRLIVKEREFGKVEKFYRAVRTVGIAIGAGIVGAKIAAVIGGGLPIETATGAAASLTDLFLNNLKEGRSPRRLSRLLRDVRDETTLAM
jgi:hypothetical protein